MDHYGHMDIEAREYTSTSWTREDEKMDPEEDKGLKLADPKVNVRIILAAFWICHFLVWTFGDMLSLLQQEEDPVTSNVVLFVAPTTATVQVLMVVLCLMGPPVYVRMTNLIVAPVYLLFNIGYLAEATVGWHYYLGVVYILFNLLTLWKAWNWPKVGPADESHNEPPSDALVN